MSKIVNFSLAYQYKGTLANPLLPTPAINGVCMASTKSLSMINTCDVNGKRNI